MPLRAAPEPPAPQPDPAGELSPADRRLVAEVKAAAAAAGDPVTVLLTRALPPAVAAALLALPEVVSVILASPPAAGADGLRQGWLAPHGAIGALPGRLGRQLLVSGDLEALGLELARQALTRGMRSAAFHLPGHGFSRPRPLLALAAQRTMLGLHRRWLGASQQAAALPTALLERQAARQLAALLRACPPPAAPGPAEPGRLIAVNRDLGPGGAERQLVATLQGLAGRGWTDLALLCERLGPAPLDHFRPALAGSPVALAEIGAIARLDHPALAPLAARFMAAPDPFLADLVQLAAWFLERRPAVVHGWQDAPGAKAGLAALLAGVPRIVLGWRSLPPRNALRYRPFLRPAFRALAAHAGVVLAANSQAGAAAYAAWLGLPQARIQVVRNGLDPARLARPDPAALAAWRAAQGLPEGAPVVGALLRFGREKQPELWLQAAARIAAAHPDARFLLVGDGPLHAAMRALAARIGLAGRIHLPGAIEDPQLALAAMDVVLLTSAIEGLPNVALEAQALGVPVVAPAIGGIGEAIEPGRTGWLVAQPSAARLAARVQAVLADPAWRAQAAARAPAMVAERFALDRMIDATLAAYGWPARPAAAGR